MSVVYLQGLGGTGDSVVTGKPLFTSSAVKYVNSQSTGSVVGGNDSRDTYASIVAALATAETCLVIVAAGHIEPAPAAPIAISGNVTIVGSGSVVNGTAPKMRAGLGGPIFYVGGVAGASLELRNLHFEKSTIGRTDIIHFEEGWLGIDGCLFEMGDLDDYGINAVIDTGSEVRKLRVRNSTFRNVSTKTVTGASSGPVTAIRVNADTALELESVVIDGGTGGFQDAAIKVAGSDTIRGNNISCLNGADVSVSSTVTGYVLVQRSTGSATVYWNS